MTLLSNPLARALAHGRKATRPRRRVELLHGLLRQRADEPAAEQITPLQDDIPEDDASAA